MSEHDIHLLIAEDMPENCFTLDRMLRKSEFKGRFTIAKSGTEAWDLLQKNPQKYTVALLDRMMPGMSGMDVLKKMMADNYLKNIPIIFQTAMGQSEDVEEGLAAGAFYYITKPYPDKMLFISIIRSAVNKFMRFKELHIELDEATQVLLLMERFQLRFKTLEEEKMAANMIAKMCPDPKKSGLGLGELLLNAVEHGNAGITYDEKSVLNENGRLHEEVRRRLALPENSEKSVCVRFERTKEHIHIAIIDEGDGFDWTQYIAIDPARIFDNHGRGIAMAAMMSFDKLEFLGKGNEVHAFINLE